MSEPQLPFVLRADRDGVAKLVLNRGERLNPLSLAMLEALAKELELVGTDRSIRVVVLAGAGKHLSAGHDLAELKAMREAGTQETLFAAGRRVMLGLVGLPQPVIARVHGAAVAAGCQLVAQCDLAVASAKATFALPGVKAGIFCTTPGVAVARNVPRKRAMELLLTGDAIDAATAERWGLVNRVVDPDELDAAVDALAAKIAALSPAVVARGKRLFYAQVERRLGEAYEDASREMALNVGMDDAAEGMDAFLGRRAPAWKGN